jgi:hypothetical protein
MFTVLQPFEAKTHLDSTYELFCTTKKMHHFTIKKINWLMLFKEITAVYSKNQTKDINKTSRVTDCYSRWDIQLLPLGFKGLKVN